jgi:aspartyl-tRNA synthetase
LTPEKRDHDSASSWKRWNTERPRTAGCLEHRRTLMALLQTDNIRDVMAFPKTTSAQDLMMDSPGQMMNRN